MLGSTPKHDVKQVKNTTGPWICRYGRDGDEAIRKTKENWRYAKQENKAETLNSFLVHYRDTQYYHFRDSFKILNYMIT